MAGVNENTPMIPSRNGSQEQLTKPTVSPKSLACWILTAGTIVAAVLLMMAHQGQQATSPVWNEETTIAFLGNSMLYFNDFPRFFQRFSAGTHKVVQNSCLHGGGSIPSLFMEGNGMFPQFQTPEAVLTEVGDHTIYDYGACTVQQLLTGTDPRLDDPGYAVPEDTNNTNVLNPCREDPVYLDYAEEYFRNQQIVWNYIVINDNTRNPALGSSRARSLQFLEQFYVPWFKQTGAVPVFLWTHAYSVESTPTRNMTGLTDVANFTSLTGAGYREYVKLLKLYLPEKTQAPRIAPVGLAFLMVYEERQDVWATLFHSDQIHASPSGTFLQGCIIYHTLFGEMPRRDWVVRHDMEFFWKRARMMQHAWEPPNPMVDYPTAEYLYSVAERIMVEGEVPASYIDYQNGEVADESSS